MLKKLTKVNTLFLACAIAFTAVSAVGVVALSSPAPVKQVEHTMTMNQMNYFLDRIHYGSK